ncbi:hypothetical protein STEG23_025766 [Scotinomys teguina]
MPATQSVARNSGKYSVQFTLRGTGWYQLDILKFGAQALARPQETVLPYVHVHAVPVCMAISKPTYLCVSTCQIFDLQTVVSCYVGAGIWTRVLWKSNQCP